MDISSPVTGSAQPDLTNPTYTLSADTPPNLNSRQWYVSAVGGTQPDVTVHSASAPFTVTLIRPSSLKTASASVLAALGLVSNVPKNKYSLLIRKAADINVGGGMGVATARLDLEIPVESPDSNQNQLEAMFSILGGCYSQILPDLISMAKSGSIN